MKWLLVVILALFGGIHDQANNKGLSELQFLQNEAEGDDAGAQLLYALAYLNGQQQLKPDLSKALYWLRRSSHQDNAYAQYLLGTLYSQGKGVKKDMILAVKWWFKSAAQDNSKAEYLLGKALLLGDGIQQDKDKGITWLEKSAKQNNQDAQLFVNNLYLEGYPVPEKDTIEPSWLTIAMGHNKNESIDPYTILKESVGFTLQVYEESAENLKQRAKDGDNHAQYELGLRYKSGVWDVPLDNKAALYWIHKAAINSNVIAMKSLVKIYRNGELDTEINEKQAKLWELKSIH